LTAENDIEKTVRAIDEVVIRAITGEANETRIKGLREIRDMHVRKRCLKK
jgi:hypothetical protein